MRPQEIGAYEAKTNLSRLLERVSQGHTFIITRRGKRLAELRPVDAADTKLVRGCDKGRVEMTSDFDAPIPGMESYLP